MYSVSRTRKKNPFVFVTAAVFGMWSESGQSCLDTWSQHLACFGILFRYERKCHLSLLWAYFFYFLFSVPRRSKKFFVSLKLSDWLLGPLNFLFSLSGSKQPQHEAEPLPPDCTEVKNKWICTFIPLLCLYCMYRINCTFYIYGLVQWQVFIIFFKTISGS